MNAIYTSVSKTIKYYKKPNPIWQQLLFFIPLAMTSFLINITHSLFNAGLARLENPAIYLSAFAVAKSVMGVIEAPITMTKQTATSLIFNKKSYYKVRKFIFFLICIVVLSFILFLTTGLSKYVLKNFMGLKGKVLSECINILKIFILIPICVTIRDFATSIAILVKKTPLVTVSTVLRIIFTWIFVMFINKIVLFIPQAMCAGLMFAGAAVVEAGVMVLGVKIFVGDIPNEMDKLDTNINDTRILDFYLPLLITAFITNFATPIVNMGLARSIKPEIAISAYSVAWGLGMMFISPVNNFHQVSLNFIKDSNLDKRHVKKFAIGLNIVITIMIAIMSFTQIGYYVLKNFIGTSDDITLLAIDVLKFMCILPSLRIIKEYYWGLMMRMQMTKHISRGKMINVVTLVATIIIMIIISPANPAVIGVVGMVVSQLGEDVYLYFVNCK